MRGYIIFRTKDKLLTEVPCRSGTFGECCEPSALSLASAHLYTDPAAVAPLPNARRLESDIAGRSETIVGSILGGTVPGWESQIAAPSVLWTSRTGSSPGFVSVGGTHVVGSPRRSWWWWRWSGGWRHPPRPRKGLRRLLLRLLALPLVISDVWWVWRKVVGVCGEGIYRRF